MSYPPHRELAETDPKLPDPAQPEATAPEVADVTIYEAAVVRTADGVELGTVAEVSEQHFRVDRSMSPDIWLEQARVVESNADRLQLDIDEADIDAYAMDRPPVVDALLSEEEHAEQRSSMERELADQRAARAAEKADRRDD